jgi:hypothetical protein
VGDAEVLAFRAAPAGLAFLHVDVFATLVPPWTLHKSVLPTAPLPHAFPSSSTFLQRLPPPRVMHNYALPRALMPSPSRRLRAFNASPSAGDA